MGYGIVLVFLGLFLFSILYIPTLFVKQEIQTFNVNQGPVWNSAYDPNTQLAMTALLYPGLGIMILFGAVIETINIHQKRKGGGEEYI